MEVTRKIRDTNQSGFTCILFTAKNRLFGMKILTFGY